MNKASTNSALREHIHDFFEAPGIEEFVWPLGPMQKLSPHFRVLRVSPGPRTNLWLYSSVGAWEFADDNTGAIEFFIMASEESHRQVELVTMTAHYHRNHHLGMGHTFPIGEPWLPDSVCDHMLISSPYSFGSKFEICNTVEGHVHFYWLLPITRAERDFKVEYGLETLEQRFEEAGLEYWNPKRASVV